MKFVFLISLLSLPAFAGEEPMCSSETHLLDGHVVTNVLTCDDVSAGKCFQEIKVKDNATDLQEIPCQ